MWLHRFDLPMDGLASYTILIRSPEDPERVSRKKAREMGRDSQSWRAMDKTTPEEWAKKIVELLTGRKAKTFNAIMLELTGCTTTADTVYMKNPHLGLAMALSDGRLKCTARAPIKIKVDKTGNTTYTVNNNGATP